MKPGAHRGKSSVTDEPLKEHLPLLNARSEIKAFLSTFRTKQTAYFQQSGCKVAIQPPSGEDLGRIWGGSGPS